MRISTRTVAASVAVVATLVAAAAPASAAAGDASGHTGTPATRVSHRVGDVVVPPGRQGAAATARTLAPPHGTLEAHTALPAAVDLRPLAPAVGDQGQVGSCVEWSLVHALMGYYAGTTHATGAPYAPLYLYQRVVAPGGAPNAGTSPDAALATAQASGVDTQADYVQGTTAWQTPPTAAEIANAANYRVAGYTRLWLGSNQGVAAQTLVEQALAAGAPVSVAIPVFQDFESMAPNTLYDTLTGTSLGGHMISIFGYDSQGVWIRNSWGTSWGTAGDAHLSWAFVESDVMAAYTITGVTTPAVATPAVTGLSVRSGPVAGGTSVTVAGTGLAGATVVSFGGTAATFTASTTGGVTTLVAKAPAHAVGTVDVTVSGPGGTSGASSADQFSYTAPVPVVTGLSPTSGPTWTTTRVVLTGSGFAGVTGVLVGGVPATFTALGPTSLQVVVKPHAAGQADIQVLTPGGTSPAVAADRFTWLATSPGSAAAPTAPFLDWLHRILGAPVGRR